MSSQQATNLTSPQVFSYHIRVSLRTQAALGLVVVMSMVVGSGLRGQEPEPHRPRSLKELVSQPPDSIQAGGIARANLLCAQGLPGAESLDIESSLALIETMAKKVWQETDRLRPSFWQRPQDYYSSEAYFRMLVLVTVVQQDFGIHYNSARIAPPDKPEPSEKFFADSNDVFINGALGPNRSGTCSSLPVFYAAIGRRLGYPLKLVTANAHLFVRWDDEREKLNIEGSGRGLSVFPDEHYRQWPFPISPEEEKQGYFLRNLTPAEEVAIFLQSRAQVLIAHQRFAEARVAIKLAGSLTPHWSEIRKLYASYVDRVESGPPKPMLLDRGQPRIVGPAASVMEDLVEVMRANQETYRRAQRDSGANPSAPDPRLRLPSPTRDSPQLPQPTMPNFPTPSSQPSAPGLPPSIRLP